MMVNTRVEDTMHCDIRETTVTALAPAKINLSLEVHGKRGDGFHALTSLVTGVELHDELTFTPVDRPGIELVCNDGAVPVDEGNLVVRAAALLGECVAQPSGVRIELHKRIPVAAGLGGGSSDGAAALRALNALWDAGLTDHALATLGAQLGSDVPLFFSLPAAVVTGRGEQVRPAVLGWSGWVVLAMGGWAVSSREVYANWRDDDRGERGHDVVDALLSYTTAAKLGPRLVNELEPAVFRTVPAVRGFQRALVDLTGDRWRVSGAGSTAFALFDTEADARRAREAIGERDLAERVTVVRNLST